jgi:tetratricopeptide (TPR) repeat protein
VTTNTYHNDTVLIKLGYYTEAIKVFDKILSIDANSAIGLYNKGTCLDKIGQHIQGIIRIELHLQVSCLDLNKILHSLQHCSSH